MHMISDRTALFLRGQLATHIGEFLDDPDGMCANDPKEIVKHYETLSVACRDFGTDFWMVVKEENRSQSEIDRLKKYLEGYNEPKLFVPNPLDLMYQRGNRDGLEGLNPSSNSQDYMTGYSEGRRTRIENKLRYGE